MHAIWTDERFSSSCVTMRNTDQINENADAARRFEPLKQAELDELRDAVLAAGPTMCPNCDGRCSLAGGTKARLGDLTRFYTYHEDHGIRGHAREGYAELTAEERRLARRRPRGRSGGLPNSSTSPSFCPKSIACWAESNHRRTRRQRKRESFHEKSERGTISPDVPGSPEPP